MTTDLAGLKRVLDLPGDGCDCAMCQTSPSWADLLAELERTRANLAATEAAALDIRKKNEALLDQLKDRLEKLESARHQAEERRVQLEEMRQGYEACNESRQQAMDEADRFRQHPFEDADRQLVLLALAVLSLESPGFEQALTEIAKRLPPQGAEMMAQFRSYRAPEFAARHQAIEVGKVETAMLNKAIRLVREFSGVPADSELGRFLEAHKDRKVE